MSAPLVEAQALGRSFAAPGGWFSAAGPGVRAVDGVSFAIARGETLAVVGESGCGKSTLGRLLLRLLEPSDGRVLFDGDDVTAMPRRALRQLRRRAQMVFQDPYGSLSPRRSVAEIVAEPLEVFGLAAGARARRDKVAEILARVGLPPQLMDRKPRQFSGGQRQRIGIARAIALDPDFIVCDEPVSALDVSVQAQIITLLQDLQEQKSFSYLFIAHDLAVVRHIADRVMVMYLGRIAEIGPKRRVFTAPHHPYTQALLSAVPQPDPDAAARRIILAGDVPSPSRVPPGCSFHTRCPLAQEQCRRERPALRDLGDGHAAACHFASGKEGSERSL